MFIVNGKILSQKEQPKLFKWYQEKCDIIQDVKKKQYIFTAQMTPTYETDDHGRKRKLHRFKSVPSISTIHNEEFKESQTWQYVPSANSIRNDNGMLSVVNPRPFVIGTTYSLNKVNDVDIIFFLLYISEALKNKHVFELDKDKLNKEKAKKSEIAAEAQYILYHSLSPISPESTGAENAIRQIAMSFGVSGVKDKDLSEVRNDLWDIVIKNDKLGAKKDFGLEGLIKSADKIKNSSKRAYILTAIEHGMIYYEDFKWYLRIKGSTTRELCHVAAHNEKEKNEYLIDYVLSNHEFYDLISAAVRNPNASMVNEISDEVQRGELIEMAANMGWDKIELRKKKNVELKEIIRHELQPDTEEVTEQPEPVESPKEE